MTRLALLIALLIPLAANAAIDAYSFPDDAMRERYNVLVDELRCPQCLNTNLAGSDAMIAQGLRREVHRLLLEGKSDDEILDFMHARYGDFILYKPRLKPGTLLLWFGPLVFFLIALVAVVRLVLRRRTLASPLTDADRDRLERLLKENL